MTSEKNNWENTCFSWHNNVRAISPLFFCSIRDPIRRVPSVHFLNHTLWFYYLYMVFYYHNLFSVLFLLPRWLKRLHVMQLSRSGIDDMCAVVITWVICLACARDVMARLQLARAWPGQQYSLSRILFFLYFITTEFTTRFEWGWCSNHWATVLQYLSVVSNLCLIYCKQL